MADALVGLVELVAANLAASLKQRQGVGYGCLVNSLLSNSTPTDCYAFILLSHHAQPRSCLHLRNRFRYETLHLSHNFFS